MKKTDWQYLVDTLLFLCIVGIVFIGFSMGLVIPKGPTASESAKYFLGLHRHQWGNIHFYLSITFTVLVIIHLVFSWNWIKGKSRQIFKKGWRSILVLTALASILVLTLFWAFYPRVPGAYEDHGVRAGAKAKQRNLSGEGLPVHKEEYAEPQEQQVQGKEEEEHEHEPKLTRGVMAEDQSGILITGRMTFYDIQKETGIPARKIADKLGLPESTPLNDTLGRLRRRYGFSMQDVKDAVADLMKKK